MMNSNMSSNKLSCTIYALTIAGVGGFFAWDNCCNFQETNTGLKYKFVKHGDPQSQCGAEQYVYFEKKLSYQNVTLFDSKAHSQYPLLIPVEDLKKMNFDREQFEALNFLKHKGDEAQFRIPLTKVVNVNDISYINEKFKINVNENSSLILTLKVLDFVNRDQISELFQSYRKEKMAEEKQKSQDQLAKDVEIIDNFVAEQKIENVKITDSGLRYVITKEGVDEVPQDEDTISLDYVGKDLRSGKIFDSSIESVAKEAGIFDNRRKYEPMSIVFSKNMGLIAGFAEGLALFNKGCEATLFIPSSLAYGPNGVPGVIDENANLIFELKVVDIIRKK